MAAGTRWRDALTSGDATEISTGTRDPDGTMAILRYEYATTRGDFVTGARLAEYADIRRAGADAPEGVSLVRSGAGQAPGARTGR